LAISLAQNSHEPILLIDADLRSPDLHNLFDHELDPGLVETLHGKHAPAETIRTTWCKNLHLMPAGRLNCSPHLLLGNGNFETLLSQLRHAYRYIVVDAPPVLPASDSLILANAADGTLLATMRDVSRTTQVREASQRLQHAGANLLGAVLSGVPMRTYTQRYGTYGVGRGMEEEYDEGYEEAEYAEAGHDDAENQAAETEQHEPG
jgi:capsular exopolysaccharide synthesis family protein